MGLDQYLKKKIFIGAEYEHRNVTGKIDIKINGKKVNIDFKKVSYIEESTGYWRKANQIHNWFVENVQGGEDDCGEYNVSKEQFEKLLSICKRIKEKCLLVHSMVKNGEQIENGQFTPIYEEGKSMTNWELAEELLPTKSGFFFGGTDYDQYYMEDIEYTITLIEEILKDVNETGKYLNNDYYYSSSW